MRIPNPSGLLALIALPAIAAMYWRRPRSKARRVAGGFLWAAAAQEAKRSSRVQERPAVPAIRDLATAFLLVTLACGAFTADSESASGSWPTLAARSLVCLIIGTLMVLTWKFSRSNALD